MGCFGYICKGCGTSIRGDAFLGGEKCVLIHIRHGKELGRVTGYYDGYGRVTEQNNLPEEQKYRGDHDGINGHNEICNSEFGMSDSFVKACDNRIYQDKSVNFTIYSLMRAVEPECELDEKKLNLEFLKLPKQILPHYSGTVAWHSLCYEKATQNQRADMTPSDSDPNQSWGKIRKKYE